MKPLPLFTTGAVLSAALLFSTVTVRAGVAEVFAFDSFGPGDTYNQGELWLVEPAVPNGYSAVAAPFVPSVTGYLDQIQLATMVESGSPLGDFTISLDNGEGLPGTALESYNNVTDAANGIMTINSVATPLLQAGQTYWLTDEPTPSSGAIGWYFNNQGYIGSAGTEVPGDWGYGPNFTSGVFSISVTPVPEPASPGLLGLGVGLVAILRWRASSAIV